MSASAAQAALLKTVTDVTPSVIERALEMFRSSEDGPIIDIATTERFKSIRDIAFSPASRPMEEVVSETEQILAHRMRMNHPRFLAFIPSPMSPVAFLGEMINTSFNTHAGSWRHSSGASAIESSLISLFCSLVGFPQTSGGAFVSGGSIANLSGVVLARDQKLTHEQRPRGTIYVSAQTHLSVAKSLRITGILPNQIRKVPHDKDFRLDVEALETMIEADKTAGSIPYAVVVTCGTTNTGSTDPLHAIADIAQRENLWMHVDGAYGASVIMSKSYKHLLDGIGRADSIAWDAHKWLFQPFGCGLILVKNEESLMDTFAVNAEYLRDEATVDEAPNYWNFSPELTRPARATQLWFTIQVLGLDMLGNMVDQGFKTVEAAEACMKDLPDWKIISPASMAIMVFRFAPAGFSDVELDRLNKKISEEVIARNVAGLLTTHLDDRVCLRIASISPELEVETMRSIVKSIDQIANELRGCS